MELQTGQRFRRKFNALSTWTVAGLVHWRGHVRHVKLVRLDDPNEVRTYSVAALSDRRYFEPLAEPAPSPTA